MTQTMSFPTTTEAWFWTMAALDARQKGESKPTGSGVPRPCEPDDVVKALDRLYRARKIDLEHARILRAWGLRRQTPHVTHRDHRLWMEAINHLDWLLRVKGIVA